MKLSKIAGICKKSKRVHLYVEESGEQWIGDGSAIYPVYHLPRLDEDSICAIFDITEKQRQDFSFQEDGIPERVSTKDAVDDERKMEDHRVEIRYEGRTLKPLITHMGVTFIDTKYLSPFSDAEGDLQLYERLSEDGDIYIAVKYGFMVKALIAPVHIREKSFVGKLG